MKLVFIGCTHAGTNAALSIKKLCPEIDITIIEKNATVSFLSCGIAIGCQLQVSLDTMFYCSVEEMRKLGIKIHNESQAKDIDFKKKELVIECLKTKKEEKITYDTLIISSGSAPIIPKFITNLSDYKNLFLCKSYEHGKQIFNYVKEQSKKGKKIAILGGGYIGIELCECFGEHGFKVTCIEGEDRIMKRYFDEDITAEAEKILKNHGCEIVLGKFVTDIKQDKEQLIIKYNDGLSLTVDSCIMCIGFRPNTDFVLEAAQKQGVKLNNIRGAIDVNEFCETNVEGIFAIGDAACCHLNPSNQTAYIPLATNAIRQAVASASRICNKLNPAIPLIPQIGTQGTSALKLYETVFASTGLSTELAKQTFKDDVAICSVTDDLTPGFVGGQLGKQTVKIVYKPSNKEILGVQVMGSRASEITQVASVLIQNKTNLLQLMQQDFSFNPWYNKPVHPLAAVAMKIVLG